MTASARGSRAAIRKGSGGVRWRLDAERASMLESGVVECLGAILAGTVGERIKQNNVRTVVRLRIGGQGGLDLFFKAYRNPDLSDRVRNLILRPRAANEWRVMRRCRAVGLPTARPLLLGERRSGGELREAYFASEAIPGMEGLVAAGERLRGEGRKGVRAWRSLLREAARVARRFHDAGIDHRDLHSSNILVRAPGNRGAGGDRGDPHLIDLHSARLHRMGPIRRMRGLTRLAHSLGSVAGRTDRLRLLRAYFEDLPDGVRRARAALGRLERGIERLERRRLRSRSRRCVLNSSRFRVEGSVGGFRLYRRVEHPPARLLRAVEAHRRRVLGEGTLLKDGRTNRITRIVLDPGGAPEPLCVKEYRERGPLDRVKFLLGYRRGLRAWRGAHGLLVRGVGTAEPLGLLLPRRGGSQYLVMRYLDGWARLDRFLVHHWPAPARGAPPPRGASLASKRRFNRDLARFFGRLHSCGIYHGDTKATNVLVRPGVGDSWDFVLLDTDRVVFRATVRERRRIKNLAQLHASIPSAATRTDRFRFLRAYAAAGGILMSRRRYVRGIERECRSKKIVGVAPFE